MANHKRLPPADYLRQRLAYDARSGICRWTDSLPPRSRIRAGERAGAKDTGGRWQVVIDGQRYALTRIIWCLHHGVDPANREITPINGNRDDHRINNLRVGGTASTGRRRIPAANQSTGFKGVTLNPQNGRFRARILINGNRESLGEFDNKYDAFLAYVQVAKAQLRRPTP
ncbi:MAG: HNH endonuclease [Synechococcaceae cyanobacterium ELA445]